MINLLKKSSTWAGTITTVLFTIVPEICFGKIKLLSNVSDEGNIILTRIITFFIILILSIIGNSLYLLFRRKIIIKGNSYIIQIEYGDLLDMCDCKKVINFDECFTTSVGEAPSEIKPSSLCGQYLKRNPIKDMQILIDKANLKPDESKSKYKNKIRYESGKLVPNNDDLLMAFAKLDEDGLGRFFSRDEFLDCLCVLWKEIDKYYAQKDVYIPILGSGITRMDGESGSSLTQQELLDIIIYSYKLSPYKIKHPYKLHIVCQKREDFSLNKIGENI
ncbi:macro domain-containing protein [Clostridium nigeriense]|uniref:macro domain-containing protein n=1 Tax=Clostridium nigeriense TaxID=1805470 RepID=UPI003D33F5AD